MQPKEETANRKVPVDVRAGTRARLQIIKQKTMLRSADEALNMLMDFWEEKEGLGHGGQG